MVVRLIDWAGVVRVVALVIPGDRVAVVVKIKGGVNHLLLLVQSNPRYRWLLLGICLQWNC